jgi:hypothetical protein
MSDAAMHNLTKRIDAQINDDAAEASRVLDDMSGAASVAGRTGSAYDLGEKNRLVRARFRTNTVQIAKIIASASDLTSEEKNSRLEAAAIQLSQRLAGLLNADCAAAAGHSDNSLFGGLFSELRAQLNEDIESLKHDFRVGIAWDERIIPLPSAPITTNINIGGQQQVGAPGSVQRQVVVVAKLPTLIRTIEEIQDSPEFVGLGNDMRNSLNEAADDLKEEARSGEPNPDRLRKWGQRFLDRLKTAGLYVAEEAFKAVLFASLVAAGAAQ